MKESDLFGPALDEEKLTAFSVKAPIILDAGTKKGVRPLLDYAESLKRQNNVTVALAENNRLQNYIRGMSRYFSSIAESEKEKHRAKPEHLSALFNEMAVCTKNTLISHVAIAPMDTRDGPARALFAERRFEPSYLMAGARFSFSFIQVFQEGLGERSSTTFPVFEIDPKMIKAVAPHAPQEMLGHFQEVMSLVNHDIWHHYTAPGIRSDVAHDFLNIKGRSWRVQNSIQRWMEQDNANRYEDWSHIVHEKVLLAPENKDLVAAVPSAVDGYFDELSRVVSGISAEKGSEKAHEAANFYGLLMAHALTRAFPLNHPVMQQCMARMEKADPMPELAEKECIKALYPYLPPGNDPFGAELPQALRRITDDYRVDGFDMFAGGDMGYAHYKLLQLVSASCEDVRPHVPSPQKGFDKSTRDTADRRALDMLKAVEMMTFPTGVGMQMETPPEKPAKDPAKDPDRVVQLFFSAQAAKWHGYNTAEIPDGAGGNKTVRYTAVSTPEEYKWKDKQLVWTGRAGDIGNIRKVAPGDPILKKRP